MRIVGTSIHAALGEVRPLDYAMVQRAVESSQREDQQLEWKSDLTDDANEVAKDVAALANARGGLLVYGVQEDRATSAATAITDVAITDTAIRAYRSKLFARLNPIVPGLAVEAVAAGASSDSSSGLLVVQVPASPDAPHVVGTGRALGVPYRVGTQTQWMSEWEIERAYQDRFARRLSDSARLDQLIGEAEDQLDLNDGSWIVTAARPTVPASSSLAPPDRGATQQTLGEAVRLSMRMFEHGYDPFRPLLRDLADMRPRVGLRRWVIRSHQPRPDLGSSNTHLELHHDGSVVFAARLGGAIPGAQWDLGDQHTIPLPMVPGYTVDLVAIAGLLAQRRLSGQVLLRTRLVRPDDLPFAILAEQRVGGLRMNVLEQPPGSTEVRTFQPVDDVLALPHSFEPSAWLEGLRSDARRHAADVVSQFGVGPGQLDWPSTPPD